MEKKIKEKLKKIKLLILDVDGVMTDGRIIMDSEGHEIKNFDVRDGHGIKAASTLWNQGSDTYRTEIKSS